MLSCSFYITQMWYPRLKTSCTFFTGAYTTRHHSAGDIWLEFHVKSTDVVIS